MKQLLTVALVLTFLVSTSPASETIDLNADGDKVGYSIGYQVAGDLKRQGIEIRAEMLLKGIQDALGDQPPAMTKEEMRQTLVDLQKRVTVEQKN